MSHFWPLILICLGGSVLGLFSKWLFKNWMDTGFFFRPRKFRKWALEEGILNDVNIPYDAMQFLKILEKWKFRKLFYFRNLNIIDIERRYERKKNELLDDVSGLEYTVHY